MKNIILITFAVLLTCTKSIAAEIPPGDSDVLESLLVQAANECIHEADRPDGETIFTVYPGAVKLNSKARNRFEAFLSSREFRLVDARKNADAIISCAVTNCELLLIESIKSWQREISLSVYIAIHTGNGRLLYSGNRNVSVGDTLSEEHLHASDDSAEFARGLKRQVSESKNNVMMVVSLALLTSALLFFAEQK